MSPLFGPSPDKILASGQPVAGAITGIEVKFTHDDPRVQYVEYAVQANGVTYGIRQDLSPFREVRLGMPVTLRIDGTNAVIDWNGSGTGRWKMLRTPPAAGITDDFDDNGNSGALSKARKGGRGATVTILELVNRSVALGLGGAVDARVRVDPATGDPYEATVPKVNEVPGYATHLPVVGARLIAWETKGFMGGEHVKIDWPASAEADPGVGKTGAAPAAPAGLITGSATVSAMTVGGTPTAAADDDEAGLELPDYAKSMMKKLGVDPDSLK
ncbi:MAG TPA: hypothetical protein VGM38_04505 [Pseudolysinimonas sp.]